MRELRHTAILFGMLIKRFCKKPSFLLLLLAVPLLALCLKNVSVENNGMVSVVLFVEDKGDAGAVAIAEKLLSTDSVIRFDEVDSEEAGRNLVQTRKRDALWIFEDNFSAKIKGLLEHEGEGEIPITVIELEDNVILQLSRVKLFGEMYQELSYPVYLSLIRDYWGEDIISEEQIKHFYDQGADMQTMISRIYEDGCAEKGQKHYMTAPLRGILILWIMLAGVAADMFYLRDISDGVMDAVPEYKRNARLGLYQLAAMLPTAVAVLFALSFVGNLEGILRELFWMLLLLADGMVFCSMCVKICRKAVWLGACIPLVMLGMFVFCPVFFTINYFRLAQYLLPPYYYLNGIQGGGGQLRYVAGMIIYAVVGFAGLKLSDVWRNIGAAQKCLTLKRN